MRNNNYFKRIFSMLLALILVIGMVPTNALAAENPKNSKFNKDWIKKVEVVHGKDDPNPVEIPHNKKTGEINEADGVKLNINSSIYNKDNLYYKVTYDLEKIGGEGSPAEKVVRDEIEIEDGVEYIQVYEGSVQKPIKIKQKDYTVDGNKLTSDADVLILNEISIENTYKSDITSNQVKIETKVKSGVNLVDKLEVDDVDADIHVFNTIVKIPKGTFLEELTFRTEEIIGEISEFKVEPNVTIGDEPAEFKNEKEFSIKDGEVTKLNNELKKSDLTITLEYKLTYEAVKGGSIRQAMEVMIDDSGYQGQTGGKFAQVIDKNSTTKVIITKIFYDSDDEYNHNSKPQGHETLYLDEYGRISYKKDGSQLVPFMEEIAGGEYKAYVNGPQNRSARATNTVTSEIFGSFFDEKGGKVFSSQEAIITHIENQLKTLKGEFDTEEIKIARDNFITIKEYIENNDEKYGHIDNNGVIVTDYSTGIDVNGEPGANAENINKYFGTSKKLKNAKFIVIDKNTGKQVTEGKTDKDGQLIFNLPDGNYKIEEVEKDEGDRYSYIDEEGKTIYVDGPLKFKAVPILLELPILNAQGERLETIHLYPKNIENVPRIKKEVIGDPDRNIGEDIEWTLTTTIPSQSAYKELRIFDLPSIGIDIDKISEIVIKQIPNMVMQDKNTPEQKYDFKLIDRKIEAEDINRFNSSVKIDNILPSETRYELPDWYYEKDNYIPTIKGIEFSEEGLKKINKFLSEKTEDLIITFKVTGRINGKKLDTYKFEIGEDEFQVPNMAVVDYKDALNLDESLVRTGGRQFIKKNVLGQTLEGAEFLVLNGSQDKYLKINFETKVKDNQKYYDDIIIKQYEKEIEAWNDYDKMVADYYNKLLMNNEEAIKDEYEKEIEAWNDHDKMVADYYAEKYGEKEPLSNKSPFVEKYLYAKSYTWVADAKDATVFRSNKDGILKLKDDEDFDLKGLSNGRYYLEEIKAPEGYAKLTNYKEFQVTATSYHKENIDEMEIINTKLTIPETGGIGSLIFIAVGLIVVTIGVQAKRKREELA